DATEPGRDYAGVDELRRMARCDLNAAVIASMEQTDQYLREQGKTPHPAAAAALLAMKREILK
ncbi:MAG TPA: phosphohydrolase, partial [Candidatus Ventrousia excrementavium]|nr:phosphohydrolase [Candidatus Ventrousia excrementavium]